MEHRKERWWDWPSAVFLVLAIFCAASRLQTTNWTEYLGRIQILVFAGAGLGLVLGYSRFKPWFSFLYALVFTIVVPVWSLASLIRSDLWLVRVQTLFERLGFAVGQLFANQPVRDPILFLLTMILLFWISGLWGAYRLVRMASPWVALIFPAIITLVVDYSFEMYAQANVPDPGSMFSFLMLLFTALLIARVYFIRSRKNWQTRGNLIENEVGFDLGRGAAITAVLLVGLAWYSPRIVKLLTPGTPEQHTLSQDIQQFRARFEKAVSSLRSQNPLTVIALNDSLALGKGTILGTDTVLVIKPTGGQLRIGRYYWAGRMYDTYLNDQWQATGNQQLTLGPNIPEVDYPWAGRVSEVVDIASKVSYLRTLYFPGALQAMDRTTVGVTSPTPKDEADITALLIEPPLRAGETYRVTGSVSIPSIVQMRASNALPYPDYVRERYLQLPKDFSPRIQDLARQITEGKVTPYDKAEAITNYLRENITYQTVLPQIPPNADPLEWFLFDNKAGFCNYYASSEVVMLRSVGVPARMVVGYAEGEWVDADKSYHVLAKDYHAWPEIFFPGLGWVPFEPTAGQPALEFPTGEVAVGTQAPLPTPFVTPLTTVDPLINPDREFDRELKRDPYTAFRLQYGGWIEEILIVLVVMSGLYRLLENPVRSGKPFVVYIEDYLLSRGWRLADEVNGAVVESKLPSAPGARTWRIPRWLHHLARLGRRSPMERLFASVGDLLRAWGKPPGLSLTPAEQVDALASLVPDAAGEARILLEEYHVAAYSKAEPDYSRATSAASTLRTLRLRTLMNRMILRKT